jgi:peroxiredoxin
MMIACRQSSVFKIKGIVAGADGQTIYLENVGLASIDLMDSVKINASGQFTFKKPRPEYPDFYRLRLNNQQINLAIDSTETIMITADAGSFATSYTVEGSFNCAAIKEITLAQLDANHETRRLRTEFEAKNMPDSVYLQRTLHIIDEFKTIALKYIYEQPMSTAAYFALFQKVDGQLLFDLYDKTDSRAYGAVATSHNHLYPKSQRAMHLNNLALQSLKVNRSARPVDIEANEIDFLEIELPDVSGTNIKLSNVSNGKVVILNFTAYQTEYSPDLNQRLQNIYLKYNAKGMEIYQVSLDGDLHIWKNIASNLPWICVHDPQTLYSQFAALYNVKQLPTIFLLDKKGIVVKRIDDISKLENDVLSLLF